jgi:hypothetical protein
VPAYSLGVWDDPGPTSIDYSYTPVALPPGRTLVVTTDGKPICARWERCGRKTGEENPVKFFGSILRTACLRHLTRVISMQPRWTPRSAGCYNHTHPSRTFGILPVDEAERDLVWNEAVGMRQPDERLREAIDAALDHLRANGIVDMIYSKYGIALLPPR